MNFSFYIFAGLDEYVQYPIDENNVIFQEFTHNSDVDSQLIVKRSGRLIKYIYTRRLEERVGNYFGFCLVFNGVHYLDIQKLFKVFENAYLNVESKGELIHFDVEKSKYNISNFAEKALEISDISSFFRRNLEDDFVAISPAFKFGNGSRNLSNNNNNNDYISAIREYDIVTITKNKGQLGEFENRAPKSTDSTDSRGGFFKKINLQADKTILITLFILILAGIIVTPYSYFRNDKDKSTFDLSSSERSNLSNLSKMYRGFNGCESRNRILLSGAKLKESTINYSITTEGEKIKGIAEYNPLLDVLILENSDTLEIDRTKINFILLKPKSQNLLIPCSVYK